MISETLFKWKNDTNQRNHNENFFTESIELFVEIVLVNFVMEMMGYERV